ncbi:hypothetical protein [Pseudomonas sp. ICMP 460]|uniref:hypothetical protein n=1 Tax=Pseudomonas sp. ICMP 460 TaxID=1718917 RepID=UPI000C07EA38|nr:hypothetical protein [Pseudomonas sp. ICMP 460]PHN20237.1 hypothetical protein AO240_21930 [Pseudomonas sp. ICMP 460]
MALVFSGCSIVQTESFTFQAELPENFTVGAVTHYESVSGEMCSKRKAFRSKQPKTTPLVELQLPLTDTAKGCSMVLKKVVLHIEGKWGKRDLDMDMDTAGLSIRDAPSETVRPFPASGPLVFQGQCQWLFRTMGSRRYIVKILQCRALDANGVVQKQLAGATLQRDQLAGKTVKMVLTVAKEETPYFGRSWLETPKGWKPCVETKETFRCQAPPTFTDFKMPDGRDCTVYPNCTE